MNLDLDHRLLEWLVLRRVADGGGARVGAGYLDGGRPQSVWGVAVALLVVMAVVVLVALLALMPIGPW